jgi:hypothetical protein
VVLSIPDLERRIEVRSAHTASQDAGEQVRMPAALDRYPVRVEQDRVESVVRCLVDDRRPVALVDDYFAVVMQQGCEPGLEEQSAKSRV